MTLKILILGGTRFVGRHIADAFVAGGHEVTLFNRGRTDPSPRAGIAQIHGDRTADLSALDGMMWDAVIDTSTFSRAAVRRSANFFETRTNRYIFISSVSVYDFPHIDSVPVDEDAPL